MAVWAGQGTTFVRFPLEPRDNRKRKWTKKGTENGGNRRSRQKKGEKGEDGR